MTLKWTGPFRVADLLANCLVDDHPWPPESKAVYLVARRPWKGAPGDQCGPLYFGGTTGASERFCTRIGDLIADMHGFYGRRTGHHSGGQKLWVWCRNHRVVPGELFLGWATAPCSRCAEVEVAESLAPEWSKRDLLNKNRPPGCASHRRWMLT